jgi:hypothetical protein
MKEKKHKHFKIEHNTKSVLVLILIYIVLVIIICDAVMLMRGEDITIFSITDNNLRYSSQQINTQKDLLSHLAINFPKQISSVQIKESEIPSMLKGFVLKNATSIFPNRIIYENKYTGYQIIYFINQPLVNVETNFGKMLMTTTGWNKLNEDNTEIFAVFEGEYKGYSDQIRLSRENSNSTMIMIRSIQVTK